MNVYLFQSSFEINHIFREQNAVYSKYEFSLQGCLAIVNRYWNISEVPKKWKKTLLSTSFARINFKKLGGNKYKGAISTSTKLLCYSKRKGLRFTQYKFRKFTNYCFILSAFIPCILLPNSSFLSFQHKKFTLFPLATTLGSVSFF